MKPFRSVVFYISLLAVTSPAQCPPLSPTNALQQTSWLIQVFSNLTGNATTATNAVNALTALEQAQLYQSTRYSCIYSNFPTLGVLSQQVSLASVCFGAGAAQNTSGYANSNGAWEVVGIVSNVPPFSSPGWILQPAASTNNSLSTTTAVDSVTGLIP